MPTSRRRNLGWIAVVILAWGHAAAAPGAVVIDETCYFRRYYRFGVNTYSPAHLRAEGDKVLGTQGLARLRRDTEREMTQQGLDPARADWMQHVLQPTHPNFRPATAPPPADWAGLDFDDSDWVRQRYPFQGQPPADITNPALGQFHETMDLGLQQACYRARFVVDSVPQAGAMSLRLTYHGGVRVLLNGQEVARGHLPPAPAPGVLAPDIAAEHYPAEAYGPQGESRRRRTLGPLALPSAALRPGVNVLAIEVRASRFHPVVLTNPRQVNWGGPTRPWPHGLLLDVEFSAAGTGVRPATRWPPGVTAWGEDPNHRTQSTDFLPPGEDPGVIRLIGARQGTYGAQVVIGTDRALTNLEVSVGPMQSADGAAALPAGAWQVQYPVPYPAEQWNLHYLGDERGLDAHFPDARTLARYSAAAPEPGKAQLFDQLTPAPPASIEADTSRPVWLSLRIPSDAKAGAYRGKVTVRATGLAAVELPVGLEVVDWQLPAPRDFQTWVGLEQNPYAVAKQYGVKPWSAEHWALLESSLTQLGRAGSRWINVPVLMNTEFGNRDDSMIRWLRRRDGSLGFDYAVLDRYLDLAATCGVSPRVIQVIVMHGMRSATKPPAPPIPPKALVHHEATGRTELLSLDTQGNDAPARAAWREFATSVVQHLKARGQEQVLYWGAPLEGEADPQLKQVLAAAAPGVYWTAGPHEMMSNGTYAKADKFYRLINSIRYNGGWPAFRVDQGWKSQTPHLLNPRVGGTVFALHTASHPFAYRVLPGRAIAYGRSGFTRVGADEWAGVHFEGMTIPQWLTGMPVLFVLWPGAKGAQSSVRFETLIEGLQDAEARIYLEQALDRGGLPAELAQCAKQALAADVDETRFFLGNSILHCLEEYHYRWQERSAALLRAAAGVAARR